MKLQTRAELYSVNYIPIHRSQAFMPLSRCPKIQSIYLMHGACGSALTFSRSKPPSLRSIHDTYYLRSCFKSAHTYRRLWSGTLQASECSKLQGHMLTSGLTSGLRASHILYNLQGLPKPTSVIVRRFEFANFHFKLSASCKET
jgi:hypothetical protein